MRNGKRRTQGPRFSHVLYMYMYLEGDCPSVDPFEACLIGTAGARSFRISASRLEEMLSGNLRRTQKKPTPEPNRRSPARSHRLPPRHTLPLGWGGQDFRESFSESCGGVAKGRKSTKVAGGARASGYCIVRTRKKCVSRLKKVQFLEKSRAARARKPDPHLKNQGFLSKTTQEMKTPPK